MLHSRGLRVPDDVAIVGFDNIVETEYSEPPLTTIDVGREEIARKAIHLLIQRLGGDKSEPKQVTARCHLVERESSARL